MGGKKCLLCGKPYNYKYDMFGRGCLENIYELLGISKPSRFVLNNESYLCRKIAWKKHKYFLSKQKKMILAEKYITLGYLNKIDFQSLDNIKKKIIKDINGISAFSKNIVETISFKLNDIYKLYNYYQKFCEIISGNQNIDWEKIDKKVANKFIKSMKFIFDITKKTNPISYAIFYSMQNQFWKIVVVGGLLTNKKYSASFLLNSLAPYGKKVDDLYLEDEKIKRLIINSESFNTKINFLLDKYGKNKQEFSTDECPKSELIIRFEESDLLYALHDATMLVTAKKDEENKWNYDVTIFDRYDFTDFKDLKEYVDANDAVADILSTTLNNFGVVSSEYGVIKEYDIKIHFKVKEGEF